MRRGLVVGKFMPLHRGHQLLIDTALANVDELTVVIYDTFVDQHFNRLMPAEKRAKWIVDLYPNIHNILILEDPPLTYVAPRGHEKIWPVDHNQRDDPRFAKDYADQVRFLGPFTHVFSSEDYGEPFADALNARHVMVDAARELVPISGTKFRSDMFKYRAYVDPLVYRSLIQKVVFVGTESTGKSTLAKKFADLYSTMYTLEYGRSLWEEMDAQGIPPRFHDFYHVGNTQYLQEEAAVRNSNDYLFCDTNAWTTLLWSYLYYGEADARLVDLVERTKHEYLWYLCENDFGWIDDGLRELNNGQSEKFQEKNRSALNSLGVPYTVLAGSLDDRISTLEYTLGKRLTHSK